MDQSIFHQMGHLCFQVFDSHGLRIEQLTSPREYEERMERLGKLANAKTFHSAEQIIPKHRCIAVILHQEGQDIGGLLARDLDLGGDNVERLLLDEARTLYDFTPSKRPSPILREMRGRVAYMGELFVVPDSGWRGKPALAAAMVRYMMCLAFSEWKLDYLFSVMKKSIREGSDRVLQYGFCTVEPRAQDWDGVLDERRDSSEYVLAISRAQFVHNIGTVVSDPVGYFPGYGDCRLIAQKIVTGF